MIKYSMAGKSPRVPDGTVQDAPDESCDLTNIEQRLPETARSAPRDVAKSFRRTARRDHAS